MICSRSWVLRLKEFKITLQSGDSPRATPRLAATNKIKQIKNQLSCAVLLYCLVKCTICNDKISYNLF